MNGQMTRYKESLSKTPKPIPFSEIKGTMDYRGLLAYAKSQGKKISELSQIEKMKFYTEQSCSIVPRKITQEKPWIN